MLYNQSVLEDLPLVDLKSLCYHSRISISTDVTINPPDEQSIMTYVSQFLEHFPGMEEVRETASQGLRSKLVRYIGNAVPFGTHSVSA